MENQQKNSAPENNNSDNRNSNNNNNKKKPSKTVVIWIVSILLTFMIWQGITAIQQSKQEKITYDTFLQMLDDKLVTDVKLYNDRISFTPISKETGAEMDKTYYVIRISDYKIVDRLQKSGVQFEEVDEGKNAVVSTILSYVVMIGAFYLLMSLLMRNMSKSGGIGKSNAKMYVEKKTGVTFADVAGQEEAKESLCEMVDFLDQPDRYLKIGAKLPKGALLVGPPGTGKTLLAKAVAGEAGVPFFSISGSDFVEMFVGVGASRVRDLFEDAKKNAPCIVFIDEIDAVARKRGSGLGGGHDEREQTLNQMLVEMDGFGTNEGIIVLAATNRVDILDPAILRPGRFDRKVMVGRPDVKGREEILRVHVRNKPLSDDVDLHEIARTTAGFAGADLENLMNEAAICAAKQNRQFIKKEDVDKCFVKIGIGGEKKSRLVPEKERKITAYHESGHAILFHLLSEVGPVHLVSIIPNGRGAGGYTMPLPENDNVFMTKKHMLQDIMVSFGGRIAEELIFGDITTGASADIKQATQTAQAMVVKYGMSEKVGLINYEVNSEEEVFLGRDLGHARNYSEKVAAMIDKEVRRIMDECYQEAKLIIESHIDVLHRCAAALLEKERINRAEFEALFEVSPTETYPDGLDTTGLNL